MNFSHQSSWKGPKYTDVNDQFAAANKAPLFPRWEEFYLKVPDCIGKSPISICFQDVPI